MVFEAEQNIETSASWCISINWCQKRILSILLLVIVFQMVLVNWDGYESSDCYYLCLMWSITILPSGSEIWRYNIALWFRDMEQTRKGNIINEDKSKHLVHALHHHQNTVIGQIIPIPHDEDNLDLMHPQIHSQIQQECDQQLMIWTALNVHIISQSNHLIVIFNKHGKRSGKEWGKSQSCQGIDIIFKESYVAWAFICIDFNCWHRNCIVYWFVCTILVSYLSTQRLMLVRNV